MGKHGAEMLAIGSRVRNNGRQQLTSTHVASDGRSNHGEFIEPLVNGIRPKNTCLHHWAQLDVHRTRQQARFSRRIHHIHFRLHNNHII